MADPDVLEFIVESSEERVLVYDPRLRVVHRNRGAARFLQHRALPPEVPTLAARIFETISRGRAAEEFPGRICLTRDVDGQQWVFRLAFRERPEPLVCVFFFRESVSARFDLNAIRRQYQLTRRESDLTRHLLDGMSNRDIAEELSIAEQTVKDHLSNVYRKIGVADRYALLRHLVAAAPP